MLVLYIVLPYLAICSLVAIFQRRLMYPARVTTVAEVQAAIADQRQIQPLRFTSGDNLEMHGLLYRGSANNQAQDGSSRPTLLYFPGNGGCRIDRLLRCHCFAQLGCNVAIFDYRGYGENPGSPAEKLILADAHQAWGVLTGELKIPSSQIIVYGESLGGAVATRLAADLSRAGTPPAGLLLSSTFSSMTEVARWHYPWLPVRWLLLDHYNSQSYITQVTCPIVMLHGTEDNIVPFSFGQRLYERIDEKIRPSCRFVQIPGTGHNDIEIDDLCNALAPLVEQCQRASHSSVAITR